MLEGTACEPAALEPAFLAHPPSWLSLVVQLLSLCLLAWIVARVRQRLPAPVPHPMECTHEEAAKTPTQEAMVPPQPALAPPAQQQQQQQELQLVRLSSVPEKSTIVNPVRLPLPDGVHHVSFADGSQYYGEWQAGTMHGRGVFFWPNGGWLSV